MKISIHIFYIMEPLFKCDGCDYASQQRTNLKRHIGNCKALKNNKIILLETEKLAQKDVFIILENKVNELTYKNHALEQHQKIYIEQIEKLENRINEQVCKNDALEKHQKSHLE